MTKKQICEKYPVIAYYSGLDGVVIHHIEYGIEEYIYCTSGSWYGKKHYHKCKIFVAPDGGHYFRINGYMVPLAECIRM